MVTDADRAVLEFLAEHRIVRTNQVAQLLGVTYGAARRRLDRLGDKEYLSSKDPYKRQPPHHAITKQGLAVIGSSLPKPKLVHSEFRHDVGLAWLWLAAHAGAFGPLTAIHSERSMLSEDGRAGEDEERFGLRAVGFGPRGGALTHYPDLLLDTAAGHRVAVELELTTKGRARLDTIMRRYAADPRIDAVLYLVDNPGVEHAVRSAVARTGTSALVHVQMARWTEPVGASSHAPATRNAAARNLTARKSQEIAR